MCILSQDYPSVKETRGWLDYLKEEDDDKVVLDEVRSRTRTALPCGDDSSMSRIEELLGWQLETFPRGSRRENQ